MPTTKNPVARYRLIDECLQRRHRNWPANELRATVAAKFFELTGLKLSQRQFAQDLADMREGGSTGYNAPIGWSRERGYYYTEPEYSIRNSPLVSDDAAVLRQALAMRQQFQGLGLGDELRDLVQRVEGHLQAQAEAGPAAQVIWFEQVPDYVGAQWLALLYRAIQARQPLAVRYRPFGAAEALAATVQPYLLKQYNHRWFLIGQGTGRAGLSNYALDRLEAVQPAPGVAYLPPPADLASRFAHVIGVSVPAEGGEPPLVRLRFRAGRGQYVRTKPLHPSQQIVAEVGEILEITLQVLPTPELETVVLSFGDDVEIMEPVELRARLATRLQAAARQYSMVRDGVE